MPSIGDRVHVQPSRPGLLIPKPGESFRTLSPEGEVVTYSRYYDQMHRAGDLLVAGCEHAPKGKCRVTGGGHVISATAPAEPKNKASKANAPTPKEVQ